MSSHISLLLHLVNVQGFRACFWASTLVQILHWWVLLWNFLEQQPRELNYSFSQRIIWTVREETFFKSISFPLQFNLTDRGRLLWRTLTLSEMMPWTWIQPFFLDFPRFCEAQNYRSVREILVRRLLAAFPSNQLWTERTFPLQQKYSWFDPFWHLPTHFLIFCMHTWLFARSLNTSDNILYAWKW